MNMTDSIDIKHRDREARKEVVSLFERWANEDDDTPTEILIDEMFKAVLKTL